MKAERKPTRGERNFNPGNIRRTSAPWKGKVIGLDNEFETFDCAENGIRALGKILLTYQRKYGLYTVGQIISRWAPPAENDTISYVHAVAREMGVEHDARLDPESNETLQRLVRAIIHHENGRVIYVDAQIIEGVERALA